MKVYKLLFILLLLSSCNNEEKLEGTWFYNFESEGAWDYERPTEVIIKNDSISFNYLYFNHWETFPLKVENDSIHFKDFSIKYSFDSDTLILNNFQKFTKAPFGRSKDIISEKSKIKIELPKLDSHLFNSASLKEASYLKFLGKRHDNNEHSLMYDNSYVNFENLINIHDYQAAHERPHDYFIIDGNTKMRDIELILMDLHYKYQLKVVMVNDINISFNNKEGLHYIYQVCQRNMYPNFDKKYLMNHTYTGNQEVPISYNHHPYPLEFDTNNYPIAKIILLKQNKLFIEGSSINFNNLESIISQYIDYKKPIISLFDLKSDYTNFLKLNSIISNIYNKKRNKLALEDYGKKLEKLDRKQQLEIKNKIPIQHIWNYSIQHFEKIIEEDNTFYGLKINYNESQ